MTANRVRDCGQEENGGREMSNGWNGWNGWNEEAKAITRAENIMTSISNNINTKGHVRGECRKKEKISSLGGRERP